MTLRQLLSCASCFCTTACRHPHSLQKRDCATQTHRACAAAGATTVAAGAGQGRRWRCRARLDVGGAVRADRLCADHLPPPAILVRHPLG